MRAGTICGGTRVASPRANLHSMYGKPTAPLSIGDTVRGSFGLWRASFKKVWLFNFIPQLLASLLVFLRYPPASSLLSILVGLITLAFYNALLARMDDVAVHGSMSFGNALTRGCKRWARTLLAAAIMALAVVPLAVLGAPISEEVAAGSIPSISPSLALFMLVYGLALSFLVGRVFLVLPILMLEDKSAWASIRESWSLTRGHWWRCGTILTILTLAIGAIYFLAGSIPAILGVASLGVASGIDLQGLIVGPRMLLSSEALSLVLSTLTTPLLFAGLLVMYYDLVIRVHSTARRQQASAGA